MSTLMRHVFDRNNALATIQDLKEAKEAEDDLQFALKESFTIGKRAASTENQK